MSILISNKITIIPKAYTQEGYDKQINDIAKFCSAFEDGIRKIIAFSKISPKPINFELGSKEEDDWLLHNWGTRNKAINSKWLSDDEIVFDTIGNPAIPIFISLIKKFKNTDFNFKFASKRIGFKTGEICASGGKIVLFNNFDNYSIEAYETAFDLIPTARNYYVLNQKKGTYVYDFSEIMTEISQNGFYKDKDGIIFVGTEYNGKPLFNSIDDLPF